MAMDFENAKTNNGIHYSRYIAAWHRMEGKIYYGGLFEEWLKKENLTDDEINDIMLIATCGKMELERSAAHFMNLEENKEELKLEKECRHING